MRYKGQTTRFATMRVDEKWLERAEPAIRGASNMRPILTYQGYACPCGFCFAGTLEDILDQWREHVARQECFVGIARAIVADADREDDPR